MHKLRGKSLQIRSKPEKSWTSSVYFSEVTSRITAIRETFEELGILLCKTRDNFAQRSLSSHNLHNFDVKFWQKEVHNNSLKFLELCKSLNVAPDLWGLHKWSAWLTPTAFQRRWAGPLRETWFDWSIKYGSDFQFWNRILFGGAGKSGGYTCGNDRSWKR